MKCVELNFRDEQEVSYGRFTEFSLPTFEARKKNKSLEQPSEPKKYVYHGRNFRKVDFMTVRAASRSVLA